MYILGISCYYHDAAAALIFNGQLIAAAEEERFSRKKHDWRFPVEAINFCLSQGGIDAGELDYAVFYEKPFKKFERILRTTLHLYPQAYRVFRESMASWLTEKLWIQQKIQESLGIAKDRVLFVPHHVSHAASAFFASPFDNAAIMTIDGVGEWATATWGSGKGLEIQLNEEIRFPHSLGLLYSTFTAYLGFEVNEGEYKVMGLASYGTPRYIDKVWRLIRMFRDGSFELDMDYFRFHHSATRMFNRKFEQLFGPCQSPGTNFVFGDDGGSGGDTAQSERSQYCADIAASIQLVTEEVILNMANAVRRQTGEEYLCFAGGVALNSVANTRLLNEAGFKSIFIQPAAGDSGGALGAALYCHHAFLGMPRDFVMAHGFWGKAYPEDEIRGFFDRAGIAYRWEPDEDKLLNCVVEGLCAGKVIGWHQGRFEWGPRALGNRSILADPRRAEMKRVVNEKIKFREPFRPFAPSVLAEKAASYFDIKDPLDRYPARFMLLVAPVYPDQQQAIPAVTHVDGTGRLQTVFETTNTRFYNLIRRFEDATGVPVVLNTSFNLRGEPIVTTPEQAFHTFARSDMDILVIGSSIISK